jgi:hypothetical protein
MGGMFGDGSGGGEGRFREKLQGKERKVFGELL